MSYQSHDLSADHIEPTNDPCPNCTRMLKARHGRVVTTRFCVQCGALDVTIRPLVKLIGRIAGQQRA